MSTYKRDLTVLDGTIMKTRGYNEKKNNNT